MRIAVGMQHKYEPSMLVYNGWDYITKKLIDAGNEVFFFSLDEPYYSGKLENIIKSVSECDWLIYSWHNNTVTRSFMKDTRLKRVKKASFTHDLLCTVDDIGIYDWFKPDVAFFFTKPTYDNAQKITHLSNTKKVMARWFKFDSLERINVKRRDDLIFIVDDCTLPENAYIQSRQIHQLPMSKIIKYFEDNGFEVRIKGTFKPMLYGDRFSTYMSYDDGIRMMKEASFIIDTESSLIVEAPMIGCIPILVSHVLDNNFRIVGNQDKIVNIVERYMPVGSPFKKHTFPAVMSYIPNITKKFNTADVLTKMRTMNREEVLNELNTFWSLGVEEPFWKTLLNVLNQ